MENVVTTSAESKPTLSGSKLKWNMAITSGFNSPTGPIGASADFGVYAGFHPAAQLKTGLDISTTKLDDASRFQRTTVLAEAAYTFGTVSNNFYNFYVGVGGGPVLSTLPTEWSVAPVVGFDIPMSSRSSDFISLGANAKYFLNTNAPESISSSLAVKYWF